MEVNKETANRLWVQQFGKKQKAFDFAGREIAKAAYNDRQSHYGWNVDHILPQSHGGKTVDYNLICCHILTNDEKADRYPCFIANEKRFEIQKKLNHHEIVCLTDDGADNDNEDDNSINFLDISQGLECWKNCKNFNDNVFVGYVKINVETNNESEQLLKRFEDFLIELFGTKTIFVEKTGGYWNQSCVFTLVDYDVALKEYIENLLDDCILLNTYREYFIKKTGFEKIQIACGMQHYNSNFEMSCNIKKDIIDSHFPYTGCTLVIDELVKINTTANKKIQSAPSDWYSYDYVFTNLQASLLKKLNKTNN